MRAYRILSCLVAVIVSLSLVNGCSRGPSEEELKQAELAEQFATITQLNETLTQTRADLESAQSSLAEIEAVKERERTDEQRSCSWITLFKAPADMREDLKSLVTGEPFGAVDAPNPRQLLGELLSPNQSSVIGTPDHFSKGF